MSPIQIIAVLLFAALGAVAFYGLAQAMAGLFSGPRLFLPRRRTAVRCRYPAPAFLHV